MVLELGLSEVKVRAERIEEVNTVARIVTSRAFTSPQAFLALAAERVAPGGVALVMLGRAEPMPASAGPAWETTRIEAVSIPGEVGERHIAVCRACGA